MLAISRLNVVKMLIAEIRSKAQMLSKLETVSSFLPFFRAQRKVAEKPGVG